MSRAMPSVPDSAQCNAVPRDTWCFRLAEKQRCVKGGRVFGRRGFLAGNSELGVNPRKFEGCTFEIANCKEESATVQKDRNKIWLGPSGLRFWVRRKLTPDKLVCESSSRDSEVRFATEQCFSAPHNLTIRRCSRVNEWSSHTDAAITDKIRNLLRCDREKLDVNL